MDEEAILPDAAETPAEEAPKEPADPTPDTITVSKQEPENQQQPEIGQKAETEMFERFLTAFPEVKPENIKPETWARVKKGLDLTTAYIEQRNRELETRLKTLRQNGKNTASAPVGSVTAHGSADTAQDPFLTGFDSI